MAASGGSGLDSFSGEVWLVFPESKDRSGKASRAEGGGGKLEPELVNGGRKKREEKGRKKMRQRGRGRLSGAKIRERRATRQARREEVEAGGGEARRRARHGSARPPGRGGR